MLSKFLSLCLGLFLFAVIAQGVHFRAEAEEIFVRSEPKVVDDALEPDQGNLPIYNTTPKAETPAPAPVVQDEPEDINAFANRYFANCMNQGHPILNGENLETMCACTAAQIPGNMTVAQMQAMQTDTEEGQLQRNRMLMFVYTPCIEYPTKALVENQCLNNPQVKESMKYYPAVCDCLSDGMAEFMRENAAEYIQASIQRNKQDTDPLRTLMESKVFTEKSQYYMRTCVLTHELGK